MEFIALLSTGKGTWGQVIGLLKRGEWEKAIIIGDDFAKKRFSSFDEMKNVEFIEVNLSRSINDCIDELKKKLKGKIKGTEVALSIASGSGKEHMALISALLNLPVGIKFAVLTKNGVEFF
ncbi:MAG: hypothetical protein QXE64_00125 [Candidatus Pacearchaeota archaeon]